MTRTQASSEPAVPLLVGVGASAGGLKAFQILLEVMPPDTGMAFVFIQHLDPEHPSMMTDLLSRRTTMSVREIEDGTLPERDHVYMIPPGQHVVLQDGRLRLIQPTARRGERMAIDTFFRSLAAERAEDAAAIVLSGTGTDGSLGLREVKERGGLCLVQTPATADYDGMPTSAMMTGVVDSALDIADMPPTLQAFERRVRARGREEGQAAAPSEFNRLMSVLAHQSGMDFRFYKTSTVLRRIERRMSMVRVEDADEYLSLLRTDPGERRALSRDLLISVTSFFRDPEVFETLQKQALPELIAAGDNDPLRIWVPGCATGEEAYTIAMLVLDCMEQGLRKRPLQIFATDVDGDALRVAREGVYAEGIAGDLSDRWLNRYFTRNESDYVVGKALRDVVVFAEQNLLTDPPFSRIDLISCRNLLIYLKNDVQERVMGLFSFALRPGGFLLLGSSESVGRAEEQFSIVSKKHRLYRRTDRTVVAPLTSPPMAYQYSAPSGGQRQVPAQPIRDVATRAILDHLAPPCVLVDRGYDIRFYHGETARFLSQPSGEPTRNLLDLLRPGLKTRLRALMRAVAKNAGPLVGEPAKMRCEDGGRVPVRLSVMTVQSDRAGEPMYLVAFHEESAETVVSDDEGGSSGIVAQLEQELTATREDLQSTIEELETSNEELKASNEEVMSMNEEFQSTNEELETSREELQSLNEELTTVNSQLQEKVLELEKTNDDLTNIFDATDIAVIFINRDGIISRFTPQAGRLLKLRASDLGRPARELRFDISDGNLHDRVEEVARVLRPCVTVIMAEDDRWYSERINPYRTGDGRYDGVVVSFVEITEEVRAQREAMRQRNLFDSVMRQATEGIVVTDVDGNMMLVNDAARRMASGDPGGKPVREGPVYWGEGFRFDGTPIEVDDWISLRALRAGGPLAETGRMVRPDGSFYDLAISAAPVRDDQGAVMASIAIFRDITGERRLTEEREAAVRRADEANAAKSRFLANLSHDVRTPLNAIIGFSDAIRAGIYGEVTDAQRDVLETVQRASQYLNQLVNDILDLSRIEAGRLTLRPETVGLEDLVRTADGTARPQVRGAEPIVDVDIEPAGLTVHADAVRLTQVLVNLLTNAFKYGPPNGTVRVRARLLGPNGGVRLTVTDQGPGMSEEDMEKAFEPFFRGSRDDPTVEGTGLGLSLVAQIMHLHGGRAALSQAEGGGLEVTLEIPPEAGDAS
ncbi:chemotaxis protein CheB [Rhodospira trueperi]|uniref:Two-component system, chemotaxis family, CheB/CheR fusion protein n=1 Tax=Rhodospira trueperi TaxID=69960 RepID=A0A1G7FYW7_9PROT|nr:chemotaxis protein CheB [Rhodospira trueperi]SDE81010.1 two-component system, chemotaxis family, CheB/CheR fusion protein [Rhodospira trueperi]